MICLGSYKMQSYIIITQNYKSGIEMETALKEMLSSLNITLEEMTAGIAFDHFVCCN